MSIFDLDLETFQVMETLHEQCRDALTEALLAHSERDVARYRDHVLVASALLARLEGRARSVSGRGVLRAAAALYEVATRRLEQAVFRPDPNAVALVGRMVEALLDLQRRAPRVSPAELMEDFLPESLRAVPPQLAVA